MLDFAHLVPGVSVDQQLFVGSDNNSNLTEWQTWRKPRGKNWLTIMAVGGGASGGCGINTTTTSGGGAGGGGGGYTHVTIPMFLVPDVLYIQCGKGGAGANTSGYVPAAGSNTVVSVEPNNALNGSLNFAFCNGAPAGGSAATRGVGGVAGSAAAAATASQMVLGVRSEPFMILPGVVGTAGGANTPTDGVSVILPTTGNICCGGTGAGGTSAAGGSVSPATAAIGSDYLFSLVGGTATSTSTPAGSGQNGFMARNYFMSYPGSGGGGSSKTVGGNPGAGGNGGLGSGGGGAGGSTSTIAILLNSGDGGHGFVLMTCF